MLFVLSATSPCLPHLHTSSNPTSTPSLPPTPTTTPWATPEIKACLPDNHTGDKPSNLASKVKITVHPSSDRLPVCPAYMIKYKPRAFHSLALYVLVFFFLTPNNFQNKMANTPSENPSPRFKFEKSEYSKDKKKKVGYGNRTVDEWYKLLVGHKGYHDGKFYTLKYMTSTGWV